jgi:AraC family transcriptional regulator
MATREPGRITFGTSLRTVRTGGFVVTETLHPPHLVLPRHDHECANLNLTIRGSFRETMGSRPQECAPSSLLVKPPGEAHSNTYGPAGARCMIVELSPERLVSLGKQASLFAAPAHVEGGPLAALAVRIYSELRSDGCASELMIEGLALELVADAQRRRVEASSPSAPAWLRRAREAVDASFGDPIGLAALAESVGVNATYFARAFRKYYGASVGEYVRRLRLEYATELLTRSELSLSDIASAAGFYDQSHLTRAFKLHMRVTPSAYRVAFAQGTADPNRPRTSKTRRARRR